MATEVPAPPADFNFARHIIERNAGRAERVAFIDDREVVSYGEFSERVRRFGGALHQLDLRREERVLLVLQDSVDWPVAFLGALYAGVVPVAVNTLLTLDDYAFLLEHSGAKAVIVSAALLATLRAAMAQGRHDVRRLIVSGETRAPGSDAIAFADVLAAGSADYAGQRTHADAIAFWLYSSGSTGRPKGVLHTHANLYWTAELYARPVLGLRETDRVFSAAKLFFAYGLGNGLSFPLSVGASAILMAERPTPEAIFKRLLEHQPSVFCCAPTGYAGMLASAELPARTAVSLRLCSSAGEALPRELGDRFTAHYGCEIIDGIGSTEMLHIYLSNRPGAVRYGTTGTAVPGYELALRDEDGRAVGIGEIGDLYVKGPSAALMYWNDCARSRASFQGEWMKTGDKYSCDADGFYTYAGRNDDMLKISGQYVSPFEVEGMLVRHPQVLEAAVIGETGADGIVKSRAFVVLKAGAQAGPSLAAELQAFVKERLAPYKRPQQIEFMADLPKTATGKIQRFRLRELARQEIKT